MPLFRWTYRGGVGGASNSLPRDDDFANIVELELSRDNEQNAAANIRPHMSHPLHEAAMLSLPPQLEVLRANDCRIRTFPVLPVSILEVYFDRNNIVRLPTSLTHLTNCIVLEINDNRIEEFDCSTMPPNLARLGMRLNALGAVRGTLPATCLNWDFNNNPTRCVFENAAFDYRNPGRIATAPRNRFPDRIVDIYRIAGAAATAPRNPYTNGQSVHNTSIQNSARQNLEYIVDYKMEVPRQVDLVRIINAEYLKFITDPLSLPGSLLETYINGTYIQHGVTMQRLIDRLWLRICDSSMEIRPELMRRFAEEVRDGAGLCSNGMFTRLTNNVLLGFDERIVVRVSNNEILSTRIPCTIARLRKEMSLPEDGAADTLTFWQQVYKQTVTDLVEIDEEREKWQPWLEPITSAFAEKLLEVGAIATELRPLLLERGADTAKITNVLWKHKLLGLHWEIDILRSIVRETTTSEGGTASSEE